MAWSALARNATFAAMKLEELDLNGKRVLIRVDLNVPLNEKFEITDDTRIRACMPTIKHVLDNGGCVVLMSHLGRPNNGPEAAFSLEHLSEHIEELSGAPITFVNDCISERALEVSQALQPGMILLLENLRFYAEETAGDMEFAKLLSQMGDIYVNDAFGTAHRAHASTAIIAQFFTGAKAFGLLMEDELDSLQKVLDEPERPLCAVIGGAKVSSKIGVLESLLPKIDHLMIGGGMAYTFIKAKGGEVGASLVEDDLLETAQMILEQAEAQGVAVHLPTDTIVADKFSNDANTDLCAVDEIPSGWMGLDIGPDTIENYRHVLDECRTILWNGPMGVFEMSEFEKGTKELALAICDSTENGAFSLIGGGDSVAAINKYDLADRVSYVSTGGGAMLEYLEGKVLPGVAAMED